jgi:hypothetical protein
VGSLRATQKGVPAAPTPACTAGPRLMCCLWRTLWPGRWGELSKVSKRTTHICLHPREAGQPSMHTLPTIGGDRAREGRGWEGEHQSQVKAENSCSSWGSSRISTYCFAACPMNLSQSSFPCDGRPKSLPFLLFFLQLILPLTHPPRPAGSDFPPAAGGGGPSWGDAQASALFFPQVFFFRLFPGGSPLTALAPSLLGGLRWKKKGASLAAVARTGLKPSPSHGRCLDAVTVVLPSSPFSLLPIFDARRQLAIWSAGQADREPLRIRLEWPCLGKAWLV